MHLWMEINVVRLHKVVETMPQQLRSVMKAKGECATFFVGGQCIFLVFKLNMSKMELN